MTGSQEVVHTLTEITNQVLVPYRRMENQGLVDRLVVLYLCSTKGCVDMAKVLVNRCLGAVIFSSRSLINRASEIVLHIETKDESARTPMQTEYLAIYHGLHSCLALTEVHRTNDGREDI